MKTVFTILLTTLGFLTYGQGCTISTSNLTEISGDDGSGTCVYSIDILFTEGNGPDNGTLTFTSASATILTGAGPHSCACTGNTYTLTFEAPCGSTVSFTAFHDNSGNGSDCTVTAIGITLAVEWLDFTLKKMSANVVSLFWSTALEINNEIFHIEYSEDGKKFEFVSEVYGSGTSLHRNDYSFSHVHDLSGILYYRIKQIDFDGNFTYSEIRHISIQDDKSIAVFPNPTSETLYVSGINGQARIHIVDFLGRKILSTTQSQIDLTTLKKGKYTIVIDNEGTQYCQQIIITN